jgi:hypothetical protein
LAEFQNAITWRPSATIIIVLMVAMVWTTATVTDAELRCKLMLVL